MSSKERQYCRLGISAESLGRGTSGHILNSRLSVAQDYDYEGVEISFDDLEYVARSLPSNIQGAPTTYNGSLIRAAAVVQGQCSTRNLKIICLKGFKNFEGFNNPKSLLKRLEKLRLWCMLASVLHTDLILISSSFLDPSITTGDKARVAADLRIASKIAAEIDPTIRIAFGAVPYGTHINTWDKAWEAVEIANRDNLGIYLNTFDLAARVYVDPEREHGLAQDGEAELAKSIERLCRQVDVNKVFLLQVADCQRLQKPIQEGHPLWDSHVTPTMAWSYTYRLFYGEPSGMLPVRMLLSHIFGLLGYRGWVTFEVFNRRIGYQDQYVSFDMAERGRVAWTKLVRHMQNDIGETLPRNRSLSLLERAKVLGKQLFKRKSKELWQKKREEQLTKGDQKVDVKVEEVTDKGKDVESG